MLIYQTSHLQISKLKKDLAEVNEDKEVTELQLQEVGDRWRSILNEKEVTNFWIAYVCNKLIAESS